jgi:hypothetical protein
MLELSLSRVISVVSVIMKAAESSLLAAIMILVQVRDQDCRDSCDRGDLRRCIL